MAVIPVDAISPDARIFIDGLRVELRKIIGDGIVGVFPYGSLAIGDFEPKSSDLDLVVATTLPPDPGMEDPLRDFYVDLGVRGGPWAKRLELAILPVDLLRRHDPVSPRRHAFINTSIGVFWFGEDVLGDDWIPNRRMARDGNIAFSGPLPRTLIDQIDDDAVRQAVRRLLKETWPKHLGGPDWMKPAKYQAFTVLTMCRALYALQEGRVITKPRAAEWALSTLDARWHQVIRWALAHAQDLSPSDMNPTLEFLRFATDNVRG